MFQFGERKIYTHGTSYLISLPMEWIKSEAKDCKTVIVQLDQDNNLVIIPGGRNDRPDA